MIYFFILIFLMTIIALVFIPFESSEEKAMKELMKIEDTTALSREAKKHSQKKFRRKC